MYAGQIQRLLNFSSPTPNTYIINTKHKQSASSKNGGEEFKRRWDKH